MPELDPSLAIYIEAFRLLTNFRPYREGVPDPIPFQDILAYAHEIDIHGCAAFDFADYVSICDSAYIDNRAKKARAAIESARNKK